MRTHEKLVVERASESGAALVTVILISFLLGIACIAMLTAVGASSRNNSDALSEYKAYYAAETGLQASINALRYKGVSYEDAVQYPKLDDVNLPGRGLTYTGTDVIINSETGYRINAVNPDASLPYIFHTTAIFSAPATGGAVVCNVGLTIGVPSCTATDRVEISFAGVGDTPFTAADFAANPKSNPKLGTFTVTKYKAGVADATGGANIPTGITFHVDYQISSPSAGKRSIRGSIASTSSLSSPVAISFLTQIYTVSGSGIELCSDTQATSTAVQPNACPGDVSYSIDHGVSKDLRANITPTEPQRLIVTSLGYGPNGARKELQGVFKKNLFDDLASTSAISLIGPATGMHFDAGTSAPTYCGRDGGYEPGDTIPNTPPCTADPNSPSGPSIGYTDPSAYQIVKDGSTKATLNPPPDMLTDVPDWQQTPTDLDDFVQRLRKEAINTGRYLADNGTNKTLTEPNFGDRSTGTGLTFCEGNCQTIGNNSGGGILVVTGKFEYSGNMSFNGLILVTGAAGMQRVGAGGGQIIGNVVIAPYNPNNLAAGFLPPQFTTTGGGNSDIVFGGVSTAFDGTTAVTNLMLGVAEK